MFVHSLHVPQLSLKLLVSTLCTFRNAALNLPPSRHQSTIPPSSSFFGIFSHKSHMNTFVHTHKQKILLFRNSFSNCTASFNAWHRYGHSTSLLYCKQLLNYTKIQDTTTTLSHPTQLFAVIIVMPPFVKPRRSSSPQTISFTLSLSLS